MITSAMNLAWNFSRRESLGTRGNATGNPHRATRSNAVIVALS